MENKSKYCLLVALGVSLVILVQVMGPLWNDNNVFQDDFRQSIFWAWSWWDPELFQNDFFKPMYDSLLLRTPLFDFIYRLAPVITDNLIWYNKLLVSILFLLSAYAVYRFFDKLTGSAVLALSSTTIFSTVVWCTDHLSCGHTRSFLWFGLFYYMYLKLSAKDRWAAIFVWIFLFLSPHVFIICFMMEFFDYLFKSLWQGESKFEIKQLINFKSPILLGLIGSFISAIVLYKVIFKDVTNQGVGTLFTAEEMKALPEFNPGGRHPIFGSHIFDGTWWVNEHWGLGIGYLPISKIILVAAIVVPLYVLCEYLIFKNKIEWLGLLKSPLSILFISSCTLYFLAQLVFPALYLPSRFIAIPWLLISVSVLILIVYQYLNRFINYIGSIKTTAAKNQSTTDFAWLKVVSLLLFTFLFWNYYHNFYHIRYVGITPEVKAILETTPKNSLIAGHPLLPDLNSASIAAKRKVFVDYERSMAYTKESLTEIRRRNFVALKLTYAKTKEDFLKLAHENGITHYMALYDFYSPGYLANPVYIEPYTQALRELTQLRVGEKFFVQKFLEEKNLRYAILDVEKL